MAFSLVLKTRPYATKILSAFNRLAKNDLTKPTSITQANLIQFFVFFGIGYRWPALCITESILQIRSVEYFG